MGFPVLWLEQVCLWEQENAVWEIVSGSVPASMQGTHQKRENFDVTWKLVDLESEEIRSKRVTVLEMWFGSQPESG